MSLFNFFKKKNNKTSDYEVKEEKQTDIVSEQAFTEIVKEEFAINRVSQEDVDYYITYFAEQEIKEEFANEPLYDTLYLSNYFDSSDIDPLFEEAARLIVIHQQGSTSLIQRKFSIGYNRSGRLMDQLYAAGIVGPTQGSKPREVYVRDEYQLEQILSSIRNGDYIPGFFCSLSNDLKQEIRNNYAETIEEKKEQLRRVFLYEKRQGEEEELERQKVEIRRELLEKERKRQLRKQVKMEMIESGDIQDSRKRASISQDVKDKVWIRDGGKCVVCGSNSNLEFDHIIPFSKGGSNSYRNLQLLCEKCNREKSNKIG